ncbi:MAG: hypothetical protein ABIQ52_02215 [Vicinamibacterales bacterium]
MKVTVVLGVLSGLALLALVSESTALAAGVAAAPRATNSQEPAVMVLSGATLLAIASLVRRYLPSKS